MFGGEKRAVYHVVIDRRQMERVSEFLSIWDLRSINEVGGCKMIGRKISGAVR